MRSTRHKLKLLRGFSRSSATTGSSYSHRNSSSSNSSTNNRKLNSQITLVNHHHSHHHHQPLNSSSNNNIHTESCNNNNNNNNKSNTTTTTAAAAVTTTNNTAARRITNARIGSISSASSATNNINSINTNTNIHHDWQAEQSVVGNSTTIMDPSLTPDMRAKAHGICRDYLHGAWKQIDCRDLVLKRVSGGLSNYLYHCSLPSTLTPVNNEPTQVLLRFYGQVHGEDALEGLITESVIFTLLSERKLGPRLYGIFPGGRVEQFIPARPLLTNELRDGELSTLIAQKMAQIHGLNIPISKEPSWLWGTMDRWMANIRDNLRKVSLQDPKQKEIVQRLIEYNIEDELQWLKKFLPQVQSPVVFSHNDLQEGNILIRPECEIPDDKLVLIDFEYCSYNYRGFDLANHFCEWSYNYNVDSYPNFAHRPEDLPSQEEMLHFIRTYVETLRREYQMNFTEEDEDFLRTSPLFNEEHIVKEVKAFTLASHFFWSLWAVVNAQVSKIPFGYWEYGLCRLENYFQHKKSLNL